MPTIMVPESPDTADARTLIEELDAYLIPLYPIEDHYGYRVEQLLEEAVAFFAIRHDGMATGWAASSSLARTTGKSSACMRAQHYEGWA